MNRAQRRRAARRIAGRDLRHRKTVARVLRRDISIADQEVPVLPTGRKGLGRTPAGLYVPVRDLEARG